MHFLADTPALTAGEFPSVAVIVAARNEERHIEEALQSIFLLDYPKLEIVAVNDRSEDGTGEILAVLAKRHPRLRVLTSRDLPPGWLGKNYALYFGAKATESDWILFTDADILFHPSVVRRAMHYVQSNERDHIAMMPELHLPGFWLRVCTGVFGILFGIAIKPWKAKAQALSVPSRDRGIQSASPGSL